MDRRGFVMFSSALAAIAGGQALAACGGTAKELLSGVVDRFPGGDEREPLQRALLRAKGLGKPLLLLVVPADPSAQWERGSLFGSLLNHGSKALLRDLALCEVQCAPELEIRKALPGAKLSKDTYMVLVEAASTSLTSASIDARLPERLATTWGQGGPNDQAVSDSIQARIGVLAQALAVQVASSPALRARRAQESRRSLSKLELARLEAAVLQGKLDPKLVDRAAAVVLGMAEAGRVERQVAQAALVQAATERLRLAPPKGAKWAISTGCGTCIEGEEQKVMVACGMGHVPEIAQRFLSFYL